MKKIWIIGWKDLRLAFRDRAALIFMLLAPFLLTLGLGLVSGRFSGSSSGIESIPVVLVNQDEGQLGAELVKVFQSDGLKDLVKADVLDDPAAAKVQVDADKAAAAVIIPSGFTASIIPEGTGLLTGQTAAEVVKLVVYANPNRPTSAGVIKSIVEGFAGEVERVQIGEQVAFSQLISSGLAGAQDMPRLQKLALQRQAEAQSTAGSSGNRIEVVNKDQPGSAVQFDVLAYMAPGMALMFLMFTASNGGRSLLGERSQGTLPRLLVSPTRPYQVLGGKIFGTFLTGTAQMLILIGSSSLIFNLKWGDALGVLVLVLAAVFAAVGWGMLITAFAKTPGQVSTAGSALMLLFGVLGGSFFSLQNFPRWFQLVSKITPNAWGLDGFSRLAVGGSLGNILLPIGALVAMGAILFVIAVVVFNRRNIAQA